MARKHTVLILILLEYGLRQHVGAPHLRWCRVLILILLEYGLRLIRPTNGWTNESTS